MDNNPISQFMTNIFSNLDGFVKAVENADGMNLTDAQKKEFKEKFAKEGGPDLLKQIQEKKEQLFKRQ